MVGFKEEGSSVPPKTHAAQRLPAHEEIETLAYQMYLDHGRTDGRDVDDWLQAERELLARFEAQFDRKARAKTA